jgi:hypothetical protein
VCTAACMHGEANREIALPLFRGQSRQFPTMHLADPTELPASFLSSVGNRLAGSSRLVCECARVCTTGTGVAEEQSPTPAVPAGSSCSLSSLFLAARQPAHSLPRAYLPLSISPSSLAILSHYYSCSHTCWVFCCYPGLPYPRINWRGELARL